MMTNSINKLHGIWAEGRCALNGWIAAPSAITAQAMAAARWDALTVDLQHGMMGFQEALHMLQAISATPASRAAATTSSSALPWSFR